jgi:hypothetical protein
MTVESGSKTEKREKQQMQLNTRSGGLFIDDKTARQTNKQPGRADEVLITNM